MDLCRRCAVVVTLSMLFLTPIVMGDIAQADDAYEENDTAGTAWHPGYNWARTWLFDISGLGIQSDEDWYRIDVDPASTRLQVDCRFTHADGDIDIELYDSSELYLWGSNSATDNEFIDYSISSGGTYYIRVFYGDAGNAYDLRWDDLTEDVYEENDALGTAWHPGYNWERKWLSDISGLGIQADEDWYRIDVDPGAERIQVNCQFTHAEGDIDIELHDSGGTYLTGSNSATDNEFIDYSISSGGTYYVRVYKGNGRNAYDLWWDDISEDTYEENDTLATAWHPGYNWTRTWLSTIDGLGIQADEDWYRIEVAPASVRIQVDCRFTHSEGDIDIELYDSNETCVDGSYSVTDNEFIDYALLSVGTYYIRVHYGNAGNAYDLRWNDLSEDSYEENDTITTAYHPGYNWARKPLFDIEGLAIQADEDWYRIDVDPGSERVRVDCRFTHSEGDIDIELYDFGGGLLASSESATDNEAIDYVVPSSGAYYLRVYKGNGKNTYDLWWDDLPSTTGTVIAGLGNTSTGLIQTFPGPYSHDDWIRVNWTDYNTANGETRIAVGDIDGDGRDEIVVGFGPVAGDSGCPGGYFELLDDDYTHLDWGQIKWSPYNSANGESWPACGDVDGDGIDEIVMGLGSGGGGFFEVFDYTGLVLHKGWGQINWSTYNTANGESRPACGDVDGDGIDEIVVGLGSGGGGFFEVFDCDSSIVSHSGWGRVHWSDYNTSNGESRPACGDVDGDGINEIVVGLGSGGGGYFEVFDYGGSAAIHKGWGRVHWSDYNTPNGESRPACGDVDGDGIDEIVIGLGSGEGGGYFEVFDYGGEVAAHKDWGRLHWTNYNTTNGATWPAVMD